VRSWRKYWRRQLLVGITIRSFAVLPAGEEARRTEIRQPCWRAIGPFHARVRLFCHTSSFSSSRPSGEKIWVVSSLMKNTQTTSYRFCPLTSSNLPVGGMSALACALSAARSSWASNYTIGDSRWRITQLYRLYQLLMDSRDQLVEDFSRGLTIKRYSRHMRLLN
jgi:hypothetical protein